MYKNLKYVDRKGTNCFKWDDIYKSYGTWDILPMSVADMDFKEPECITNALKDYVANAAFGYYSVPDSYYEAFIQWEEKYHGYKVEKDWIRSSPGVVPAVNWFVDMCSNENDGVLVTTPVYYPFMDAIKNHKRNLIMCDLVNTDGVYTIDFDLFEKMIVENSVKIFIMSSPHNPAGRVWTREELAKLTKICADHNVLVLSDEIHGDLILEGYEHVATAPCAPDPMKIVTLTSASKTFNLAAMANSIIIIPDDETRAKFDEFCKGINWRGANAFGYVAYEAAWRGGREWLDELLEVVRENYEVFKAIVTKDLDITVSPLEGTYLLWADFGKYLKADEIEEFFVKKAKLGLDYGSWFGGERFATFARFNLATSKENVEKAANAVVEAIKSL